MTLTIITRFGSNETVKVGLILAVLLTLRNNLLLNRSPMPCTGVRFALGVFFRIYTGFNLKHPDMSKRCRMQ